MRAPIVLSLPLLLLATAATASEPGTIAQIEVSNPSAFPRPDTLVRLSLDELGVTGGPLQVWEGDAARPTQLLDDDGDGSPDALVFLADLGAAATHSYLIDRRASASMVPPRAHAEVSIKEGGAWQGKAYAGGTFRSARQVTMPPQASDHNEYLRYEGPGIESDQVGYRVYLDWRNGFDIFGKKTSAMVLPTVGLDGYESYHQMADWGADILKVGESLGMGGFGTWNGKKTVLVSDVAERSTAIKSDGPVHASFVLDDKGWKTGAATVDLLATLSMQAGSPMVDVAVETSAPLNNLAIGLVTHPEAEVMVGDLDVTGEAWSYLATFGRQTLFEGDRLGMVLLFHKMDLVEQTRDENSQVLVLRPRGKELSYAFGALWSGQKGGVQTREELLAFLKAEVERRTLAPRIRLKTEASRRARELSPVQISTRLAESEMARRGDSLSDGGWDSFASRPSVWNYTTGLLMQAMDDLSAAVGDPRFAAFAKRTIDSYLTADGTIRTYDAGEFNIDSINSGKMLQRLWGRDHDPKYRAAIGALAAQLAKHPRTSEGAFWHKQRYPHQLWLDGVYMGMPFLAGVGVAEGDDHKVEEAVREFTIARSHLRDARSGLYYHAWDEARKQSWADPETGRSRFVWGRGLGWYAMALVDILDVIPPEKTELRAPLLAIIPELAESLVRHQDATGVWFQILDKPAEPGNYREASATAMFTYFLAKAINKGYLPASFEPAAKKAYAGLIDEFVSVHADGSFHLTNVVETGGLGYGRDGSYRYYMSERVVKNDPKGLGPAIMAGLQITEALEAVPEGLMAFEGFDLTGRIAIVLGGTSGIGRALVDGLVEAGADVAASSRRQAEVDATALAIERRGKRTLRLASDVTDRASLEALREAAIEAFGKIDILINCAGRTQRRPTLEVDDAEWQGILDTNLTGTLRACQVFGAPMLERGYGRIVNIASLASFVGLYEVAAYAASKAGVAALTKTLAVEWGSRGVLVNAIAPGVFRTSLNQDLLDGTERGHEFKLRTPLGRFGRVEELAGAAVFLASEAASFVNGEVLVVDGGFLASGVNQ